MPVIAGARWSLVAAERQGNEGCDPRADSAAGMAGVANAALLDSHSGPKALNPWVAGEGALRTNSFVRLRKRTGSAILDVTDTGDAEKPVKNLSTLERHCASC